MKKTSMLLLLTVVLMMLSAVVSLGEVKQYKKNISVVFDDSGSMAFDVRWAHANYALQTLVSVLDEGDILQIHYMNDSSKDIAMAISGKTSTDQMLNLIRMNSLPDLIGDGETPIEAISIGMSKFTDSSLKQEGTLYDNWLVLITDGNEMTDSKGKGYVNYIQDNDSESGYKWVGVLDRKISSILSSSSLDFSTVILKIGDSSQDMLLNSSMVGRQLIYKSASVAKEDIAEKQIIENMNDIASLISGRLPIEIVTKAGNEMVIESQVPFSEFSILLQNSSSKVVKVLDAQGIKVDVETETTDLIAPENQTIAGRFLESDSNLYGSGIKLVSTSDEALPAGRYTVIFDGRIDEAKVASYCYPFIQFVFKYYVNGLEVEKVFQEDMVSLEFVPVRGGTKEVLLDLPKDINYTLNMKSGDQFLSFKDDQLETNEFLIKDSRLEGGLTAEIPGVWLWTLNVSESIPVAPEEERQKDRVFTLDISQVDSSVSYQDFDLAQSVFFTPKLNGEKLSKEQMKMAQLNIVRIYTEDGNLASLDYELNKLGSAFEFKPVYTGFKPSLPSDKYIVEVRFSSNEFPGVNEYAFGEITYTIEDAPLIIRYMKYVLIILGLLLVGAYLIGIVIKPKIKNKEYQLSKYYYNSLLDLDAPIDEEYQNFQVNQWLRFTVPFVREQGRAFGIKFKAGGKKDYIYLLKESQQVGMRIGEFELKAGSVANRDLRVNLNQKIEQVIDGKLVVYQYEKIKEKKMANKS